MQEQLHMVCTLSQHNTTDLEKNSFCVLAPLDEQHHVAELSGYLSLSAKAVELQFEEYAAIH